MLTLARDGNGKWHLWWGDWIGKDLPAWKGCCSRQIEGRERIVVAGSIALKYAGGDNHAGDVCKLPPASAICGRALNEIRRRRDRLNQLLGE